VTTVKRWFNTRYPYYRLCMHPWCFRGQAGDYRCHLHQGDK
jgi:hypothetical protein